jgi:putative toxin-antitoxin system antitoxin component (TIGR02293 family)
MATSAKLVFKPSSDGRTARLKINKIIGLSATDIPSLIREVRDGFSYQALASFESVTGLQLPKVADLIGIPSRTLARRKSVGRLSPEESERLLRISSLLEKAVELFEGDTGAAVNWLSTPKAALDSQTPLEYSRTEIGAREVEDLIGRLEHGVFS